MTRALIVGGGIAGCSVAGELSSLGIEVHLAESAPFLGNGASGNPYALIAPYLSRGASPHHTFFNTAFQFTHALIKTLESKELATSFEECGALQLPSTVRLAPYLEERVRLGISDALSNPLTKEESSRVAGIPLTHPSLHVPKAGMVQPKLFCDRLLTIGKTDPVLHFNTEITNLIKRDKKWMVGTSTQDSWMEVDIAVIANAYLCKKLAPTTSLRVEPVKGQIATVEENPTSHPLRCALCYDGYILPSRNGHHLVGASYQHRVVDATVDENAHQGIFDRLTTWIPTLSLHASPISTGRASFRTSTHDRLPFIGELPHSPGIFISVGHGSKGFVSAPWGAALIGKILKGETLDSTWNSAATFVSLGRVIGVRG